MSGVDVVVLQMGAVGSAKTARERKISDDRGRGRVARDRVRPCGGVRVVYAARRPIRCACFSAPAHHMWHGSWRHGPRDNRRTTQRASRSIYRTIFDVNPARYSRAWDAGDESPDIADKTAALSTIQRCRAAI
eukprot:6366335-Prymnesium_polylepis.2